MTRFTVAAPPSGLSGRLRVPGDKSISHRALLLAGRAEGRSIITGLSIGADVAATAGAVGAFGAGVERLGPEILAVTGGAGRLREPDTVIDVGNSGTAIRLLAGWCATIPGLTVLNGDASVRTRPMGRVVDPLRAMGATIDGRRSGRLAPLVVRGGPLHGIDCSPPVPSAQVKSAVLLAGLGAEGPTTVREATPTRAHTEDMLAAGGADIEIGEGLVTLRASRLEAWPINVPGDPSQAAFWTVAASVVPGSDLVLEGIYVGRGRAGFIAALQRMGADITVDLVDSGAAVADVRVRYAPLVGTVVGGEEVAGLIDEIPALAVAAAFAEGTTVFEDAAELRVKESDRIVTMTAELMAVGVAASAGLDGFTVEGSGGRPLAGGVVASHGDHRVAMAMAVAGLGTARGVTVDGWEAVATSYPTFEEDLRRCSS